MSDSSLSTLSEPTHLPAELSSVDEVSLSGFCQILSRDLVGL